MEKFIEKARKFFITHKLLINDNKTELILIGSKYQLNKIEGIQISFGNCKIVPSLKVKNLGVVFDQYLNFNKICHKSMYQIHKLNLLKKYLYTNALACICNIAH